MLITITQYRDVARGPNGTALPIGGSCSGFEALADYGAATELAAGTALVRVATDTDTVVDAAIPTPEDDGEGSAEFMPAGSVEWFAVQPGQVLTFADPASLTEAEE